MSKRFGRNQRRRAREQYAALEYEHGLLLTKSSMQDGSLRKAAREVQQLREQLDIAKVVIGRNHPAFPPERLELGFFPAPNDRFSVKTGPRDITTMARMTVTAERDTVFNEVHFILTHGDKRAGYALSEMAIRRALRSETETVLLCQSITAQLVESTIEAYRNVGGRNGR